VSQLRVGGDGQDLVEGDVVLGREDDGALGVEPRLGLDAFTRANPVGDFELLRGAVLDGK
jgi:hypothetical protein